MMDIRSIAVLTVGAGAIGLLIKENVSHRRYRREVDKAFKQLKELEERLIKDIEDRKE